MKTNYHTHTNWCDGRDSMERMALAAVDKGFSELGFSTHAMLPAGPLDWTLTAERIGDYVTEARELADGYDGRLRILCGIEADYLQGASSPDRRVYAAYDLDYVIGSVHFVRAPDGAAVAVDASPRELADGIAAHFGGGAEALVRAYFAAVRESLAFDFDVVGHPDLVRKFNLKHPYFDERAAWCREELERTADAIAASGKVVEVNTGAISRGWLDDAYPSAEFRALLRSRGVRFVLSSDAHSADALDCAFDRFAAEEEYVDSSAITNH